MAANRVPGTWAPGPGALPFTSASYRHPLQLQGLQQEPLSWADQTGASEGPPASSCLHITLPELQVRLEAILATTQWRGTRLKPIKPGVQILTAGRLLSEPFRKCGNPTWACKLCPPHRCGEGDASLWKSSVGPGAWPVAGGAWRQAPSLGVALGLARTRANRVVYCPQLPKAEPLPGIA